MRHPLLLATALIAAPGLSPAQAERSAVYDPDSTHPWNRLFQLFYVRHTPDGSAYGGDVLDPYLAFGTHYLVSGSSSRTAERMLTEFLATNAERLVMDPVKRAMLQRDLLAVYVWLTQPGMGAEQTPRRAMLAQLVVRIIRKLALSDSVIAALPSAFALGDSALPAGLADSTSGWVCLGRADGTPVAPTHLQALGGRSTFVVFLNVPGGHAATLGYLAQLRTIPTGWRIDPQRIGNPPIDSQILRTMSVPFPEPPQIPAGTRVALLRFANLVDRHGRRDPSTLVESVQVRQYDTIPGGPAGVAYGGRTPYQRVFESQLSRRALFAHNGVGLRMLDSTTRTHSPFLGHGDDIFENPPPFISAATRRELLAGTVVLRTCGSCHEAVGLPSFISYSRERFGSGEGSPPKLVESTVAREVTRQIDWLTAHGNIMSVPQH